MKIAIYCEDRYGKNGLFNLKKEANLEPYFELRKLLWEENCVTHDMLEEREDKDDFIIISWLPINIFTIKKYFPLFRGFRKNKKYLFLKEPPVVAKLQYNKLLHVLFDRIYTWNDTLVDNKKYFKLIWQQSNAGINTQKVNFTDKKLITLINGNKFSPWKHELYSEREKAIRFYENNAPEDFDLYWTFWNTPNLKQRTFGFTPFPSYKWKVDNKYKTVAQYKFNICYENMDHVDGYITEKIWDSFKSKSVPIYLWADNIDSYIPQWCYIDKRDFESYEALHNFLKNMNEKTYETYITNIEDFLKTPEAKKNFSKDWAIDFILRLQK